MLLQRLREYAERLPDLPPPLYVETPVRYIIALAGDGRLLSRTPIDTADPSSAATKRGQRRLAPQIQRTVGIKPLLLADNAEYTLGLARAADVGKEASRAKRASEAHAAYLTLVDRCAVATGEPGVQAVASFLHKAPAQQLELPDDFDRSGTITFTVNGDFVTDLPSVQQFWVDANDPGGAADGGAGAAAVMQCLICGRERPALERLQARVKGVPGGQTSGTAIISANSPAFESYGLTASLIAPTCADCGERFTKAINALLTDPARRLILGGVAFVVWEREPTGFNFLEPLRDPKPEEVRDLLASARSGRPRRGVDETAFYAAALTASGGRTVVRDWIDTTVGEAQQRLGEWFARQAIVDPWGAETRYFGIVALAGSTVRELKDLPARVPRALLRAALTGAPLPIDLLYEAVRRARAEQAITPQRAALIKLVLASRLGGGMEEAMVQLDPESTNAAYRCGRLLAVLEEAQRLAIPGVKASIVDRFYGTASTAPVSVFSRLLRGAQPHLAKLERDRRGAYVVLQRYLEEILAGLRDFPRTLTLEEQGRFALGYYHQRAHQRAQAHNAAERRRAAASAGSVDTPMSSEETD